MPHYIFQVYFIFVLSLLFERNTAFAEERAARYEEDFSIQKCASRMCTCEDFEELRDVTCDKGSDQMWLQEPHNNSVYELYFTPTRIQKLPAGIFRELALHDLTLDEPTATVDENIFERMDILKNFNVRQSGIKVIPNFSFVKDSIQNISIEKSRLTSLEGRNLQNLSCVEYLSFRHNSIYFIDPDVFKGTENVKYLYLDHNQLKSIPTNILTPMKNLITFQAHSNYLSHIANIFSTRHSQSFLLKNSTSDHSMECEPQINEEFPSTSDSRHGKKIKHLVRTIFSKQRIKTLDLSYNEITKSSEPIVQCCKNSNNRQHCFIVKIEELNLTGNKLTNLGFLLRFTEINSLQIAENKIQYLTAVDFTLPNNISTLDLQNNSIQRIDTNTFINISTHLHSLDLSSNLITSLNGSIKYLRQLRKLNLKNNAIESLSEDEFADLKSLSYLDFQNNQIKTIEPLQNLLHLKYLNIKHNHIELIRLDHIPKNLMSLHLEGNPFKCTCAFVPFLREFKRSKITIDATNLCLKSDQEIYDHKRSNCPRPCSCKCVEYEGVSFILVDCSSNELSIVPLILESIFFDIQIIDEDGKHHTYRIEDNVLGINLENNDLMSIGGLGFPPNLIQLYVSNNKIKRFPYDIIEQQMNLKQVTLSRNPWKCDCEGRIFRHWISSIKNSIRDLSNVCCGTGGNENSYLDNKLLWNVTEMDLCPPAIPNNEIKIWHIVIIVALAVVTLLLIGQILYNKYVLRYRLQRIMNGVRRPIPPVDSPAQKWEKRPQN